MTAHTVETLRREHAKAARQVRTWERKGQISHEAADEYVQTLTARFYRLASMRRAYLASH